VTGCSAPFEAPVSEERPERAARPHLDLRSEHVDNDGNSRVFDPDQPTDVPRTQLFSPVPAISYYAWANSEKAAMTLSINEIDQR